MKQILDMCCGSKMFWFDRNHDNTVFMDKRKERHILTDSSSVGGFRVLDINPDVLANFKNLPFKDQSFWLVVFDPPHLSRNGQHGWMAKKYGTLQDGWRQEIHRGFKEAFRVLHPLGTLIFKWNTGEVSLNEILKLSQLPAVVGNKYGKRDQTHWLVFMKPDEAIT